MALKTGQGHPNKNKCTKFNSGHHHVVSELSVNQMSHLAPKSLTLKSTEKAMLNSSVMPRKTKAFQS